MQGKHVMHVRPTEQDRLPEPMRYTGQILLPTGAEKMYQLSDEIHRQSEAVQLQGRHVQVRVPLGAILKIAALQFVLQRSVVPTSKG